MSFFRTVIKWRTIVHVTVALIAWSGLSTVLCESPPERPFPGGGCKVGSTWHQEGNTWNDGCNDCTCINGRVVCTEMACIPEPVSRCEQIDGQCRRFSSCLAGEVEGRGTCNRMSKCCVKDVPINRPRCKKTNGGKCMKKGKLLKCNGIIDKDYKCPGNRICCFEGDNNNCPLVNGEVPCPMDCAIEFFKDSNGCEACRCKPGSSANPFPQTTDLQNLSDSRTLASRNGYH